MAYVKQESESILSTLDKGLYVLQVIADESAPAGASLTEISLATGINRTTLYRILATLEIRNFVFRDHLTDRYSLGMGLLSLTSKLLRSLNVREISRPILEEWSRQTQELVFLTVQDRDEIVTVEAFESSQQISMRAAIGERRPMYCTASGKAILAHLPELDVTRIMARGMPAITPRTITSPVVLRHNLVEVRVRGYAMDDEERHEGVRCVAAPIFNAGGRVIAATSIAAPAMRTSWERLEQLGLEVRDVASLISSQLGFTETANDRTMPSSVKAAVEPQTMNGVDESDDPH